MPCAASRISEPGRPGWPGLGVLVLAVALPVCTRQPAESVRAPAAEDTPEVAQPDLPLAEASQPANACTLVTAVEVEAVIGEAVQSNLAMQSGGSPQAPALSQCNYASITNPAIVSLTFRRPEERSAQQESRGVRDSLRRSGIPIRDVPGLGEDAFWAGNQLHVFAADGSYIIVTTPGPHALQKARALSERALARR